MQQTLSSPGLRTREVVTASMFAALILLATSVLKIQTPTFGYIHIGDAFVLLAGFLLGPVTGGLAAGIGSALSDLIGGYILWVPGTFLIKFLTAAAAAFVLRAIQKLLPSPEERGPSASAAAQTRSGALAGTAALIAAGIVGEAIMVIGYFFCNILVVSISNGGFTRAGIASAAALAVAGLPFNAVQGATGIALAAPLYPLFRRLVFFQH